MPSLGSRRPPAPTCEDCVDEDTQGAFTDSRAPANVAVKRTKSSEFDTKSVVDKKSNDGSDSGYSSKAGNSDIMPSATLKKGADLKIKTKPIELERERQPYVYAPTRPEEPRSSPTKAKAVKDSKMTKQPRPFQHPPGVCWTCDEYGFHFDPEREFVRPATVAPIPQVEKSPAPKSRVKEESDVRPPTSRRSSSTARHARPTSMYAAPTGYGLPYPMELPSQMLGPNGWPQHPPPSQNNMQQFSPYQQHSYFPPTPVSGTFVQQHPSPFDMSPLQHALPDVYYGQPPHHGYGAPVSNTKTDSHDKGLQRAPSRHRAGTTKSRKPAEADKAAHDRMAMPPPLLRPERVRPVIQKTHTDHSYTSSSRRRSVFEEDDDERAEFQAALLHKERTTSQSRPHSRPPSAWKDKQPPPGAEIQNRPKPRKSSSYETPSGTIHVASSREMPRRRTDPVEQTLANAEAYLKRTKKSASAPPPESDDDEDDEEITKYTKEPLKAPLTPEALRILENRNSAAVSDAGSVRSKRSSGESAAGRTRAGTTLTSSAIANITLDNGVSFSIPTDCDDHVNIQVGNFRVSMTPMGYDDELRPRELKRIERAPSEASHASRKSLTNSSAVSASRAKEEQLRYKSAPTSKRPSRAASTSRPEKSRGSIDYSVLDESWYLDYGA